MARSRSVPARLTELARRPPRSSFTTGPRSYSPTCRTTLATPQRRGCVRPRGRRLPGSLRTITASQRQAPVGRKETNAEKSVIVFLLCCLSKQHSAYIVQLDNYTRPAQHGHIIDLVATLLSRQRSALCHDLIRCDMSLRRSTPQDATDGNLASRTYQFSHVDEDYDKPTHFTRTCGVAALPFFTRRLYRIDSGSKFTVDRSSLAGNSENTGVVCRKGLELQNMEHRMNETP
jgi:hypothetical protein